MNINIQRTVITIDGLAASGKSTLAKLLAKELGYLHVNTGLLYRASALLALENNISESDSEALTKLLAKHNLTFEYSLESGSRLLVDGIDRSDQLHSGEVATFTSKIAAIPALRESLRILQLTAFPNQSIVAEGRDTGTIIFPNATVKFFIIGDPQVRASRRARELQGMLSEQELGRMINSVAQELKERDERDSSREVAPLKKAEDAIVVDNTQGELSNTVKMMVEKVRTKVFSL